MKEDFFYRQLTLTAILMCRISVIFCLFLFPTFSAHVLEKGENMAFFYVKPVYDVATVGHWRNIPDLELEFFTFLVSLNRPL